MNECQQLILTDELQLLEKEYTVVAMTTLASLKHNKVPPSYIYQHILNLPEQTIKSKYKKLIEKRAKGLTTASLEQVFLAFSPYCDFLNPDLLEQIVERFGDEISCTIIAMYIKRLRDFRRRTLLSSVDGKWVALTPPGYVEMTLEMDEMWKKKTLEDLEGFRAYPTRTQWFFKRVDKEGAEVVFSVPVGVWLYQDDLASLRKQRVIRVSEEGRSVVELGRHTVEVVKPHPLSRSQSLERYMSDDQLSQEWSDEMTFTLDKVIQFGFHRQAGDNIFVSRTSHRAMTVDQASGSAIVYTALPMRGMAEFEVRLLDYAASLRGSLKMGLMRRKSNGHVSTKGLPKLSEHRDNSCMWFKSRFKDKTEFQNNFGTIHVLRYYGSVDLCDLRQDDHLGLQLSSEGDLTFFVNGMSQGVAAHRIYQPGYDVYCFLELVSGYRAVEITRAVMQDECREINSSTEITAGN